MKQRKSFYYFRKSVTCISMGSRATPLEGSSQTPPTGVVHLCKTGNALMRIYRRARATVKKVVEDSSRVASLLKRSRFSLSLFLFTSFWFPLDAERSALRDDFVIERGSKRGDTEASILFTGIQVVMGPRGRSIALWTRCAMSLPGSRLTTVRFNSESNEWKSWAIFVIQCRLF